MRANLSARLLLAAALAIPAAARAQDRGAFVMVAGSDTVVVAGQQRLQRDGTVVRVVDLAARAAAAH